ncbi:hypothetical protein M422DRAFT_29195 [Sphaerobolus stellatus SS14]|uniref:Uncharacterized protein n=1 Tax=Sphaerobolus stellatus (strain SS14) TaxID=990650 RepID=A0A0C9W3P9_SPHS4|nr:hypothetical protein M422DRAFT_29195 [Sphaerobolus stellatus SS14]
MIHTTKSVTRRYFLSKNEDVDAGIDDIDISTMPAHLGLGVSIWLSITGKFYKPKGTESKNVELLAGRMAPVTTTCISDRLQQTFKQTSTPSL